MQDVLRLGRFSQEPAGWSVQVHRTLAGIFGGGPAPRPEADRLEHETRDGAAKRTPGVFLPDKTRGRATGAIPASKCERP
jgi:hypothetical protein